MRFEKGAEVSARDVLLIFLSGCRRCEKATFETFLPTEFCVAFSGTVKKFETWLKCRASCAAVPHGSHREGGKLSV